MDRHEAARQAWSHLSSDEPVQAASSSVVQGAHDFNEEEFLEGAKLFFSRFQQARSQGDYDDLKSFMSDEVYAQAVADVGNGADVATEVMLLNARLMEMKSDNNRTSVSVFYDGQVRRGTQGERMEHLRAVWEFSRDDSEPGGLWILETINKVDQ